VNRWRPALPILTALLIAVPLLSLVTPAMAASRVNRCLDANGNAVYTDRACEQVGAQPAARAPDQAAAEAQARSIKLEEALDCAQTLSDFSDRLTRALNAGDANALAALHDWVNTGRHTARWILADIEALLTPSGQQYVIEIESDPSGLPVAVSIFSQTRGRADADARLVRGYPLRRHAGCWWLFQASPGGD